MLLWQQKNMPKRAFWIQLLVIISFLHVIGCIIFLLQSAHGQIDLHVFAHQNYDLGADVVLLPFVKEVKKVVYNTSLETEPSAVIQTKEVTVVEDVSKECKKVVSEKTKEIQNIPSGEHEPDKQLSETKKLSPETSTKALTKSDATPIYVGRKQFDALQVQRAIVEELKAVWHPPQGLSEDLETILFVEINLAGDIASIETQQESGVLMYDIHARTAVYAMHFPRACSGKQITITFKQ